MQQLQAYAFSSFEQVDTYETDDVAVTEITADSHTSFATTVAVLSTWIVSAA